MRVIIAGSRTINDIALVRIAINNSGFTITEVVCGGAKGVDRLGEQWAKENDISIEYFLADWDMYGRRAGILRNSQMAKYADALITVWDGVSPGTNNMIAVMSKLGKPIYIQRG